jgi:hypothetical protein
MQYESAKSELQSPPENMSLSVMAFEAVTMVLTASLMFWLI